MRHDTQSLNWYQTLGKDLDLQDKTKERRVDFYPPTPFAQVCVMTKAGTLRVPAFVVVNSQRSYRLRLRGEKLATTLGVVALGVV